MTTYQINDKLNRIFRAHEKWMEDNSSTIIMSGPKGGWMRQRNHLTKLILAEGLIIPFDIKDFWRAFTSILDMKWLDWDDQKKLIKYLVKWANQ